MFSATPKWILKNSRQTVFYSLLAIKPDKERAPNPSPAFPFSLWLFMEKREGIVEGLKRLEFICGAGVPASARGHLKRGKHLPVEKRGGGNNNCQPGRELQGPR